ncbi:hypothetical protein [Glycomyces arizonensis]|uniref:hypothetical protein n=1 Tax=Glycomyces arizonensis TaxID=256035 RepID=UPI0003FD82C8|nr:hypothetical protein [Glycomyces arizonensis]
MAEISAPGACPCTTCGAQLEPEPGSPVLSCPFCGTEQHLRPERVDRGWASLNANASLNTSASPGVEAAGRELVLPFRIDQAGARRALREWTRGRRRFAPRRFNRLDRAESLTSVYVPHWAWSAEARSRYRGERGSYHWARDERGNRFRRTLWRPAAGTVACSLVDVLVPSTTGVPRHLLAALAPDWRPEESRPVPVPGHRVAGADVEPRAGLAEAELRMDAAVRDAVRRDIGGDEQRVGAVDTVYSGRGCRSLLLPVWSVEYTVRGRSRQVLVSGWSARVAGARAWSAWKLGFAFALPLIVMAVALVFLVMPV